MLLFPLFALLMGNADSVRIAHSLSIDEVVVEGSAPHEEPLLKSASHTPVTRHEIEQSLQPSLLSLLTEEVPGLFVTSRGVMGNGLSTGASGSISIRGIGGAPTTGVLVVVDGMPHYSGLMGHSIADNYLTHDAARVEVIRGPASVRYGSQAMGGVISITTHPGSERGFRLGSRLGGGSYGVFESQLRASWQGERLRISGSGCYNRSDGHRPNMGFGQAGGQLGLHYRLSPRWQLGADLSLDHFDSSNPGPVTAPLTDNDAEALRGMAALLVSHQHTHASGSLRLFWSGGRHRINDGHTADTPPTDYLFHSLDHTLGLSLQESLSLFRGNTLTLGVELLEMGGEAENRYTDGSESPIGREREREGALYLDLAQQLGRWRLQGALRYDHHSRAGGVWVPQGGVEVALPLGIELRGSVSKGFRFPTIREMYLFASRNPQLRPEQVVQYEVAAQQRLFDGRLRYGVTLYRLDGKNTIRVEMVEGRPQNQNTGRIRNRGLEAELVLQPLDALRLEADYSLLKMRYPQLGAPEHKLSGRLVFDCRRWLIKAGVQHIAGLLTRQESPTTTALKESYTLVNLRLTFRAQRWLNLWLRGENLLGTHYEINYGFPMPKATFTAGAEITL